MGRVSPSTGGAVHGLRRDSSRDRPGDEPSDGDEQSGIGPANSSENLFAERVDDDFGGFTGDNESAGWRSAERYREANQKYDFELY